MNPMLALRQYQKIGSQAQTSEASPHRLVQMLMEGGLDRIAQAKGAGAWQGLAVAAAGYQRLDGGGQCRPQPPAMPALCRANGRACARVQRGPADCRGDRATRGTGAAMARSLSGAGIAGSQRLWLACLLPVQRPHRAGVMAGWAATGQCAGSIR